MSQPMITLDKLPSANLRPLLPPKLAHKEKAPRFRVGSTMATSYYKHFANYCKRMTQVTQFVPSVVRKKSYTNFLLKNPDSPLQEKTLMIGRGRH